MSWKNFSLRTCDWRNIVRIGRLFLFVFLICGTIQSKQANAGFIGKSLVATGVVTGVAVGSAIITEEIGAAVVAALIAAKIGSDTHAYRNAITDLKMVLALHRIVGKHLANKALNNEVKKDPSLADIANQVRADAGISKGVASSVPPDPKDDYCKLLEQIAITAAAGQPGTSFAIGGKIHDLQRLVETYGHGLWEKVAFNFEDPRGNVEVHFYRNASTGEEVEFKIKSNTCK